MEVVHCLMSKASKAASIGMDLTPDYIKKQEKSGETQPAIPTVASDTKASDLSVANDDVEVVENITKEERVNEVVDLGEADKEQPTPLTPPEERQDKTENTMESSDSATSLMVKVGETVTVVETTTTIVSVTTEVAESESAAEIEIDEEDGNAEERPPSFPSLKERQQRTPQDQTESDEETCVCKCSGANMNEIIKREQDYPGTQQLNEGEDENEPAQVPPVSSPAESKDVDMDLDEQKDEELPSTATVGASDDADSIDNRGDTSDNDVGSAENNDDAEYPVTQSTDQDSNNPNQDFIEATAAEAERAKNKAATPKRRSQRRQSPKAPKKTSKKKAQQTQRCSQSGGDEPTLTDYRVFSDKSLNSRAECRHCGAKFILDSGRMHRHTNVCGKRKRAKESEAAQSTTKPRIPPSKKKKIQKQTRQIAKQHNEEQPSKETEDNEQLSPHTPRRSKRIQADQTIQAVLKESAKMAPHMNDDVNSNDGSMLEHFDQVNDSKRKKLCCTYCGAEVPWRSDSMEKHQLICPAAGKRSARAKELATKLKQLSADEEDAKSFIGSDVSERGSPVDDVSVDDLAGLVWLFGSLENVDSMKAHYRRVPLAIHGSMNRFQQLQDDGLCGLDVHTLLEHASHEQPMRLLLTSHFQGMQHMEAVVIDSVAKAKELYGMGESLAFGAPTLLKNAVVPPLAKDLGVTPLVAPSMHEATLVCCRSGKILSWQFHRMDCFVFQFGGKAFWKIKKGSIQNPIRCFHPSLSKSLETAAEYVKVHRACVGSDKVVPLAPPFDNSHLAEVDNDPDDDDVYEVLLDSGSVVYLPAGTWFEVEGRENALWLEVKLSATNYAELVSDGMKQLMWAEDKWRASILATQDSSVARRQFNVLLDDLKRKVARLQPADLLPEYLFTNTPGDETYDGTSRAGKYLEIDLATNGFKAGKHVKVFKGTMFRVNPLAVLMRHDEIPHAHLLPVVAPVGGTPTPTKKALKKKPRRKNLLSALSRTDENQYILHVGFGNESFHSRIHVRFHCSPVQSALIEWIRSKGADCFQVLDASGMLKENKMDIGDHVSEEAAKYVLRFLSYVGYISTVKIH